jgi:LPS export ABC transporter protein LptC
MFRRFVLLGIMVVSVLIITLAIVRQRGLDPSSGLPVEKPDAGPPVVERGFELKKHDGENNLIAVITGVEATQETDKGPVSIVKPTITFLSDKNSTTVVSADMGRIEGRQQEKMLEGWLRGNVVMTITDKAAGDNTVVLCDEMRYEGSKEQLSIPGAVTVRNRSMEISGSQLSANTSMSSARLEKEVKVVVKETSQDLVGKISGEEQKEAPPGGVPRQLLITCDGAFTFQRDPNRGIFEHNVLLVQGEDRVRADGMVIEFQTVTTRSAEEAKPPETVMTIQRVTMNSKNKDGVVVEGPVRQAWGDRLEYDARTGLLVFNGSPCRMVQKGDDETHQIEGNEIRSGRGEMLGQGGRLPDGMGTNSQKTIVSGEPAMTVTKSPEAGRTNVLTGRCIIFDQDAGIVWLRGDEKLPARAQQEDNRVSGTELEFFQRTETRGEMVTGRGPGLLEVGGAQDGTGRAAELTVIKFGDAMSYLPDARRAEFTGGVNLVSGRTTTASKTLNIEFAEAKEPGARGKINRITASGDVIVAAEKLSASAETLVHTYPDPASDRFVAVLSAKPGGFCEIVSGYLVCRAGRIDMVDTPLADGRRLLRAKGHGAGYVLYRPERPADATASSAQPFEVYFSESGVFDEAAQEAVFDGDVRLKRAETNLAARHVLVNFAKRPAGPAPVQPEPAEEIELTGITASGSVLIANGPEGSAATASGEDFVWVRRMGTAELRGGSGERGFAKVISDKSELEAPLMLAYLKGDKLDRLATSGGGRLTGYTQVQTLPGKTDLRKLDVTWSGEGVYETRETRDPQTDPTSVAKVKGGVHASSEDADVTADALTVDFGPGASGGDARGLGLDLRKAVATGNARAKMFVPEGNYYRFARGDSLEWDRRAGSMVVTGETADAVVWDNSNEWIGKRLVVNRTAEGALEAESTSGRKIIFYEEGAPAAPSEDARAWKPIY